MTGLLAGYALGTGTSHEPVRAPEIITGTWNAGLQVMKAPKPSPEPAGETEQPLEPDSGRQ